MRLRTVEGSSNSSWYALYTRHQHEKTVAWLLRNKDFEVFLPLYRVVRRWEHRFKEMSLPLFPNYVFIQGGFDRWLKVVSTPGVYTVVGSGDGPSAVPLEEIEAVRRMMDSSLLVEPHPFLKCGDYVRVKAGPLAGVEGILTRKKGLFRLVLSVEMLGRSAAVEIDVTSVEPLGSRDITRPTESFHQLISQHSSPCWIRRGSVSHAAF